MLNNKFVILFSLFICFLFSLSTVSAINHTDSVGSFCNDSIEDNSSDISYIDKKIINEKIINTEPISENSYNNKSYSFHVNVTVKDFKKQNTYIVSNYNYPNEFKGFKNKQLLLNFTVYDENGVPVKNGTKVAVYIFSKEYNSTVNLNGQVTIPVAIESTGKFAFEVRYYGNDYYENSRNFTYISIIDEEFESDLNNSENVSLSNNFDYDIISKNCQDIITLEGISVSKNNQDIITFDNFIYKGISKKLTFVIPKIEGSVGDVVEVCIYAFFNDGTSPNMNLTVLFNGIKIPVHCINGLIKFNITLPDIAGIYSLDVLFNSSGKNPSNDSVINKSDDNKDLNNLEDLYNNDKNYSNGLLMDKSGNPIVLLIILISSLFIPYKKFN